MKAPPIDRWDRETTLVGQIAAGASLLAFLVYFRRGDLLLYGDAVAHINIARRVFDSRTPGLLQLGTVWLPLPHLLMIPFLLSDSAWRTGIGGSIPSMVAYVLGTVGIFRLVRGSLSFGPTPDSRSRIAAWCAAAIYAANPNLIYLQTTAMTESLYLALFVWAVVHFSEFVRVADTPQIANSSLWKCGLCLAGACWTRYDAWLLTIAMCLPILLVAMQSKARFRGLRKGLATFLLLAAATPALWLAYNRIVYRNPFEFANGPYSARAIEKKNAMPSHPGSHDLPVAFSFFLKSAELNMAEGDWGRGWIVLLVAGILSILMFDRQFWPFFFLLAPVPFYVISVAYGGVPIFLPAWWPFSSYNARYGLEMLPAFAAFGALVPYLLVDMARKDSAKLATAVAIMIPLAASYAFVWRSQPICYREASVNSRTRIAFETELASNLNLLPHDSTLLMYSGDHVGAIQKAGIPLRRVINEGNHRPWEKPADQNGLWERALADPHQYVDYVVAMEGDPVALGVNRHDLASMVVVHTIGQPAATIYWTQRPNR